MSEHPPEPGSGPEPLPTEPEPALMPRWVPIAIGVVLVAIGALAVITGLRYRDDTLVGRMRSTSTSQRPGSAAPPGEPEPGASRILSEREGANVPRANIPDESGARASISGGPGGVVSVVRMAARRGMQVVASPGDAVVYVNDIAVGHAREFDSEEEIYDFAAAGSYNVRIAAPGFKERQFVVTARHDAPGEVARIEVNLERQ